MSSTSPGAPARGAGPAPLRRRTARVLPVDPEGRVLLLHGWDPHHPERPFWFTIGGATTDKYGWLAASELEDGERPAHPDIPDLMRAAAARVRRE